MHTARPQGKLGERMESVEFSREVQRLTLPSIGTTDGSLMEGEMARFSATAASARRPRALSGGVEESLGRLVRPVKEAPDSAVAASRLRSEGRPDGAGFSRVDAVFDSLAWPLEPRAMKSPGGGCPAEKERENVHVHNA